MSKIVRLSERIVLFLNVESLGYLMELNMWSVNVEESWCEFHGNAEVWRKMTTNCVTVPFGNLRSDEKQ